MSKSRNINTHIWTDTWFEELDIKQKLLFLYLLSNDKTNMLGIYEISLRKISFDTGLEKKDIINILDQFTKDGKLFYKESHVILCNFLKHQSYNPNMKISAINHYNELPNALKGLVKSIETSDLAKGWLTLYKALSNAYSMVPKIEREREIETEEEIEEKTPPPFPKEKKLSAGEEKIRGAFLNDPEKKEVLDKWIKYRKEIKKPIIIESTIDQLIEKFKYKDIAEIKFVVNLTIESGWQGLIWEKYTPQVKSDSEKTVAPSMKT